MDAWWNVDIRGFPGIDEIADVTLPWPWPRNIEYVYGEHFLEHLALGDAIRFLEEAIGHLRPGGRIRLSTPGLEWVWLTHFPFDGATDADVVQYTYRTNRAFHGWGHQFLYSRPLLRTLLTGTGFVDVEFHPFGESDDPQFRGLERHGTPVEANGWPSVWNVEATRPVAGEPVTDPALIEEIEQQFIRYVRQGA